MSSIFKTEHYEIFIKSGDMERCIHDLVFHLEDPRVGQSYPNFYASKLASKFVKVVLSGRGETNCLQVILGGISTETFKKNSDFLNLISLIGRECCQLMNLKAFTANF